ncbi:MAG: hydroxymethylbilane synthase [Gemmatimonadaceae bacterium]|nr:hydroxymethylbilane synthase [Gemmatimonadaceae bacterium]
MPSKRERDPSVILIGTRASDLALRQAKLVADALTARGIVSELVTFKTMGDKKLDQPLSEIGAKGLFTRELETALQKGKVDCCVHSLKDLPTTMPDGLEIVAQLEREDPRDAVVINKAIEAEGLDDLPAGSRVGTSSLRRRAQLLAMRSDLEVVELRGNVPTRLKKLDSGQVHAAILAAAGLIRLDARNRIRKYLDAPDWLPAAGQGAIAIQIRSDDDRLRGILAPLDYAPTSLATRAERSFLAALEGGCQVPIGALAVQGADRAILYGMLSDISGREVLRGEREIDLHNPEASGEALADDIRSRGGNTLLAALREPQRLPAPQPE